MRRRAPRPGRPFPDPGAAWGESPRQRPPSQRLLQPPPPAAAVDRTSPAPARSPSPWSRAGRAAWGQFNLLAPAVANDRDPKAPWLRCRQAAVNLPWSVGAQVSPHRRHASPLASVCPGDPIGWVGTAGGGMRTCALFRCSSIPFGGSKSPGEGLGVHWLGGGSALAVWPAPAPQRWCTMLPPFVGGPRPGSIRPRERRRAMLPAQQQARAAAGRQRRGGRRRRRPGHSPLRPRVRRAAGPAPTQALGCDPARPPPAPPRTRPHAFPHPCPIVFPHPPSPCRRPRAEGSGAQ